MGPETFDAAVHAATLYQNALKAAVASDAVDDRIFSLQKAVAELQKNKNKNKNKSVLSVNRHQNEPSIK